MSIMGGPLVEAGVVGKIGAFDAADFEGVLVGVSIAAAGVGAVVVVVVVFAVGTVAGGMVSVVDVALMMKPFTSSSSSSSSNRTKAPYKLSARAPLAKKVTSFLGVPSFELSPRLLPFFVELFGESALSSNGSNTTVASCSTVILRIRSALDPEKRSGFVINVVIEGLREDRL